MLASLEFLGAKMHLLFVNLPNEKFKTTPEMDTLANNQQNLKVCIDKHRAGKIAVIIKGFVGTADDLKALGKILKAKCGVGGSAKNGEIIIQGDLRDKVMDILAKEGYNYKRVGG